MAQKLEDKIIGLYSLGISLRDISAHKKETYDTDISTATLSNITYKTIPCNLYGLSIIERPDIRQNLGNGGFE
jgi:hypothetical protein